VQPGLNSETLSQKKKKKMEQQRLYKIAKNSEYYMNGNPGSLGVLIRVYILSFSQHVFKESEIEKY
jgi:hypothetical protein